MPIEPDEAATQRKPRVEPVADAPSPALPRPVYFICPSLRAFTELLPKAGEGGGRLPARFVRALETSNLELTWLVQSYLLLRARGLDVHLREDFPQRAGLCIHLSSLTTPWGGPSPGQAVSALPSFPERRSGSRSFRVAVCPDRPVAHAAHLRIFQNPSAAAQHAGLSAPHWPQPGLLPREPSRGDKLENIRFMGAPVNLDDQVRSERFAAELAAHGFRLEIFDRRDWHDYRHCDVVLALRNQAVPPCLLALKPASKLVNAWHAGVPAILGHEPAYETLRRSPLDFLAVRRASDVLGLLKRLRAQPELVRAMREHGRSRAAEFSEDAVAAHWQALLAGPIEERYQRWLGRKRAPLLDAARFTLDSGRETLGALAFWRRYKREERALQAGLTPPSAT